MAIIDWDGTRGGSRVANLGDFLWGFVHPAVYGEGEPAAHMLRAAVDGYDWTGGSLVDAMLDAVRTFAARNPDLDWGRNELHYMERNAEAFEASLAG